MNNQTYPPEAGANPAANRSFACADQPRAATSFRRACGLLVLTWVLLIHLGGGLRLSAQTLSPWAVLLCNFKDNQSEPPVPNFKTACQSFFTPAGNGTYNGVRFFQDMSHGKLDTSGSQVFGWLTVDANTSDILPDSPAAREKLSDLAMQAALGAGIPLFSYDRVAIIPNIIVGGAQGGTWGTIWPMPGIFADYRYITGGGTAILGEEMGHAYGLDHPRRDGSTDDYQDKWDGMGALNTWYWSDPVYHGTGPGFNAWNMRGRGWLDESRVWHGSAAGFSHVVQLRPLYRRDLPGLLAAELPPNDGVGGHGRYLVEFRTKESWDYGIPRSAVLVHRFEGTIGGWLDSHSYIMAGTKGQYDLVTGDRFDSTAGATLEILAIDEVNRTATVRVNYLSEPPARYVDKYYSGSTVDGSFTHPYKRLLDAYNTANNGDAIFIRTASYTEALPPITKRLMMDSYLGTSTIY
jgi:hypothetical protein